MNELPITSESVRQILSELRDPETGRPIGKTDQIGDIQVSGNRVQCQLRLTTHSLPISDEWLQQATERLQAKLPSAAQLDVKLGSHERPPVALGQIGLQAKSVIAVGSGKGGVGKSTVAASIALTLSKAGCKVGLMDADVYGPSIPHLLGLAGRPQVINNKIQPIYCGEMPVMSMGFLVDPDQAVIWRGPMLHGSITQFLRDTYWGPLDYLIIDMPPGTGDIALTLSQLIPLTGAVVVCTPQQVALLDAVKAIAMFRKTKIPMLGMVENMSGFICPDNGKRYDIFGTGGAKRTARELDIPFLGELPIQMPIREHGDAGTTGGLYDDPASLPYLQGICERLVGNLAAAHAARPPMPSLPVL